MNLKNQRSIMLIITRYFCTQKFRQDEWPGPKWIGFGLGAGVEYGENYGKKETGGKIRARGSRNGRRSPVKDKKNGPGEGRYFANGFSRTGFRNVRRPKRENNSRHKSPFNEECGQRSGISSYVKSSGRFREIA